MQRVMKRSGWIGTTKAAFFVMTSVVAIQSFDARANFGWNPFRKPTRFSCMVASRKPSSPQLGHRDTHLLGASRAVESTVASDGTSTVQLNPSSSISARVTYLPQGENAGVQFELGLENTVAPTHTNSAPLPKTQGYFGGARPGKDFLVTTLLVPSGIPVWVPKAETTGGGGQELVDDGIELVLRCNG